MSTSKLFGKDILITSTTEATSNTVGAFSTLGGINVAKTILTAGGINSISNTNTLGNIFTTGGNIGIGTTAPTQALSVEGNFNFTGSLFQNGSVYSGSTQWGSTGANIYYNTGNVGLGTLDPIGRLHMANPNTLNTNNVIFEVGTTVDGANSGWSALNFNGYYNGGEYRINTSKNRWRLAMDQRTTTDKLMFDTFNGTTITTVMTFITNGNIGIGTLSPAHKLDVIGTIDATTYTGANIMISGSIGSLGSIDAGTQFLGQANDTISAPSFSWTGDTNTGMYRPATDTLGFVTNGAERMRVSSAGNVGIGTTSPSHDLEIIGDLGINKGLRFVRSGTLNYIQSGTSTGITASAADLRFTDINANTTYMTIASSGNMGIGTTSPSAKLEVNGGSGTSRIVSDVSGTGPFLDFANPSGTNQYLTLGAYNAMNNIDNKSRPLHIYNSAGSIMFMNTSGNVGIGTTNPAAAKLTFQNSIGEKITLWGNTNTISNYGIGVQSNLLQIHSDINLSDIAFGYGSSSSFTEIMRIKGTGNVGIGTTSPSEELHIKNSSDCYILINGGASAKSGIKMLGGSVGVSSIYQDDINTDLKIDYDSTNLMTIEPTGNVGIGTTAPNAKLDVNYSGITQNQNVLSLHGSNTATTDYNLIEAGHGSGTSFVVKGNSNVGIGTTAPAHKLDVVGTIDATTYTGSNIMISGSIGSLGSIDAGSQFLGQANDTISAPSFSWTGDTNTGIYRPLTDQLGFVTNGVERMRVSSAGNVGIGTTAPQTNLHINNGGLQLGAGNTTGFHFLAQNGGLNAYSGTWGTGTTRFCCDSRGNFGIGTLSPTFTLDVNGTIARNGVRLPRFDNGSFSGSSSFSIPILFNDTNYNYCEIKVRYVVSSACNINISATNYVNVAMGFNECALTTVRWNAQGTPVYTTFSSVTSGLFANDVEQVGLDNNLIFRIVRATGTSTSGIRNQYSYDNVYCWSGTGTARGYGQGHIDNTSLGGSPLQFITFTCSTGTVSGTYSTVHSY